MPALLMLALFARPALADRLDDLLADGPLVQVRDDGKGGVAEVTALIDVHAPVEAVWARVTDFAAYPSWMPGVLETTVRAPSSTSLEVDWILKVPGPNVHYTGTYELDRVRWTVRGRAIGKNLAGSWWTWTLESVSPTLTRIHRTALNTAIQDNWLLNSLGDHKAILELGINTASPIIEVQSVRKACEAALGG